jgi:hypothetical protein
LSATILRIRIISALQGAGLKAASQSSQNIVYNNPTVSKLADFIVDLAHSPNQNCISISHETTMEAMIALYSEGLDLPITASSEAPSKTVVLLTGSTGNLGAEILVSLLLNKAVDQVYTINRPSAKISISQRHRARFQDKSLDVGLLSSDKLVFLEGETFETKFGLSNDVYSKVSGVLSLYTRILTVCYSFKLA